MRTSTLAQVGAAGCGIAILAAARISTDMQSVAWIVLGLVLVMSPLAIAIRFVYEQRFGRSRRTRRLIEAALRLAAEGQYEAAVSSALHAMRMLPPSPATYRVSVEQAHAIVELICQVDPIRGNGEGVSALAQLAQARPADVALRQKVYDAQTAREVVDALLTRIVEQGCANRPELYARFPATQHATVTQLLHVMERMSVITTDDSGFMLGPEANSRLSSLSGGL